MHNDINTDAKKVPMEEWIDSYKGGNRFFQI